MMVVNGFRALLFAALGLSTVSASTVHHFYDEDLEKLTSGADDYFVLFTSTWCGHQCKHIEHLFIDLADIVEAEDDMDLHIGIIDGAEEKGLTKAFDVTEFPTLKYFCGGTTYHFPKHSDEYKDNSAFLKFIKKEYFAHAVDHKKRLAALKAKGGFHPDVIKNHKNFDP